MGKEGVAILVLPPVVVDGFEKYTLTTHAKPLHELEGSLVPHVAVGSQSMQFQGVEREVDHGSGGLGRIALPLVVRVEEPSNLSQPVHRV